MKKIYIYPDCWIKKIEFDDILVVSKIDDILDIFDDEIDEEL
jgi:hypothetical protein